MGAGEAIITTESGCVAIVGEGPSRALYEARIEPLEPVATVGSGDAFLAGYVAARYQGRDDRECLASASPAGPSRPSTSAPARSTAARSSGSRPGSRWPSSRSRRESGRRVYRCYHRLDLALWGRGAAKRGFFGPFRGAFFVREQT